jgi:small redox-active disulfide protein 2
MTKYMEAKMLSVKILGSGCENCKKVEAIARKVVSDMGLQAQVEKVTDYAAIHKYPILATPGLVVNEKVVCAGRIPSEAEVTTWLLNAEMAAG